MKFHVILAFLASVTLFSGCASRPLLPWRSTAEPPATYTGVGLPSQFSRPSVVALRAGGDSDYDRATLEDSRALARSRSRPAAPAGCSGGC